MSIAKKSIFACLTAVAVLLAAEVALRLLGRPRGPRLREVDWTLRDCQTFFPRISEAGGEGRYTRVYSFPAGPADRALSFGTRKPRGALRVFCLGGSAAYGRPYFPQAAFSAWLERDIRRAVPDRPCEVINAAQPGMDSFGLMAVAREALRFQPDLIVVYCGNNEFLPHNLARARAALGRPAVYRAREVLDKTAFYGLLKDVLYKVGRHPRLTEESGRSEIERKSHTDTEREWILGQFRQNLAGLAKACSRARVRLVLCTVPTNLRDYDPNISRGSHGLPAEAAETWIACVKAGQRLLAEGKHQKALGQLRMAESIDAQPAELHFQLARCLEATGAFDGARVEYVAAKDLDRYPIRATTAINDIIREIARQTDATRVDLEAAFQRCSEHGLPGYDLFRDHCHLTLKAHRLVALEVMRAMREASLLPSSVVALKAHVDEALDYDAILGLTASDHAAACEEVGIQILREVSSRAPNIPRRQRAKRELQQALALDPNRPNALLHLGLILASEKQREEATRLLRRVLTLDPHIVDGHAYALGVLKDLGVGPEAAKRK